MKTDGSGSPWSILGARNAPLAFASIALAKGELHDPSQSKVKKINLEFTEMAKLFEVGPTHDLIGHRVGKDPRGAFEFHEIDPTESIVGADLSLWAAKAKLQKKLIVNPTHRGVVPRELEMRDQQGMREKTSSLFYARNMSWTSQALLVASTHRPAMGGRAWTTLGHHDLRILKAFALWANSTFGLLVHWSRGQRTHPGRSTTQIRALKQIPVPFLDKLDSTTLDMAQQAFDELSRKELLPACQAHVDPTRKEIDQVVIRILNLPNWTEGIVHDLRILWCSEPSVRSNNQAALKLLKREDDAYLAGLLAAGTRSSPDAQ